MNGKKVSSFSQRFAQLFNEYIDNGGTQQELAKVLGVSRQTVGAWCTGERSPKQPTVEAIANKFHVDIAWLSGYDVQRNQNLNQNNGNGDVMALREQLRRQPGARLLLDAADGATEEEIRQYANLIKALRRDPHDDT